MTEREKAILSEKLFDEIGLIDDRFIYEAATPYKSRRNRRTFGKILLIAAALSLTFCIITGTLFTGALFIIGGRLFDKDMDNEQVPVEDAIEGDAEYSTLSDKLCATNAGNTLSKNDIDLYDNTPKVIWQVRGEEEYRVAEISQSDASALTEKMSKNSGTAVSSSKQENGETTSIWISLGDGMVVTPHLALTSGNVGYGELFDYEQEYEPSEEFSKLLIETVS